MARLAERPGAGIPAARDAPSFVRKVLIVAVAAVVLAALYVARRAVVLIYLAILLATAMSPLVRLIERWALRPIGRVRVPRTVAILILYVVVLGGLGSVAAFAVMPLAEQAQQLWSDLPRVTDRAQDVLVAHGVLHQRLGLGELLRTAPAEKVVGTVTSTGLSVAGTVAGGAVLVVLVFYLLVEFPTLVDECMRLVPRDRRARVREAALEVAHKVSAWLGGHVALGIIMATSTAIGLGLIGLPYYYVLALIAFVGEFLPYIGALIVAIAGILIALSISWTKALWVAIFLLLQHQVENHLLVPQIFERQVGLGAATVIVAILLGAELYGILGIVLAVPSAAIVQVLIEQLAVEDAVTSR